MLKKAGSVASMEVLVQRWTRTVNDQNQGGRWITKKKLMDEENYTESLSLIRVFASDDTLDLDDLI